MISAKSAVVSRNGSANDRMPALARCISRAITSKSVVSRDSRSTAVGYHHVAGGELLQSACRRARRSRVCFFDAVALVILNTIRDLRSNTASPPTTLSSFSGV
jgi:hypothetical protein